jgi:hypothetical protein
MERGLYPITSKYRVQGAPGSNAEKAVEFTAGIRSFYDIQVGNVYDEKIAGEKKRIEDAFKTFMIEKNYLNADQVNFLRTIQTVFAKKHHVEYSDLFEPPFTNFGVNAPIPLFQDEDLKEVIQLCSDLERESGFVSP